MPELPRDHAGHVRPPGVEIDYCPKCRGVWLDRGELDKLIERGGAVAQGTMAAAGAGATQAQQLPPSRRPDFVDSDWGKHHGGQGHRRKNWLSEIFD
jgi:Zn-finger nucleic acid-binding protein